MFSSMAQNISIMEALFYFGKFEAKCKENKIKKESERKEKVKETKSINYFYMFF